MNKEDRSQKRDMADELFQRALVGSRYIGVAHTNLGAR